MSEQTAWSIERNDIDDRFEVLDETAIPVAFIPIGSKAGEMARQRRVRDLIAAAPAMQRAIRLALNEIENNDKPDIDALHDILGRAFTASTGGP